jgi:hypothetical protein
MSGGVAFSSSTMVRAPLSGVIPLIAQRREG